MKNERFMVDGQMEPVSHYCHSVWASRMKVEIECQAVAPDEGVSESILSRLIIGQ